MIYPSLGQVLIRQGWEASLPNVGLSKTLRIRPAPCVANSEEGNTWLGFKTKFPPTKRCLSGFKGKPPPSPFWFKALGPTKGHYGRPFLRPSAYKVRVGGDSPLCGIEQIRAGRSKGRSYPSQSEQYLIGERFDPPHNYYHMIGHFLNFVKLVF